MYSKFSFFSLSLDCFPLLWPSGSWNLSLPAWKDFSDKFFLLCIPFCKGYRLEKGHNVPILCSHSVKKKKKKKNIIVNVALFDNFF